MKKIIYLLISILLISNVYASYEVYDYRDNTNKTFNRWHELINFSKTFKTENDFQTVFNIESFVEDNLNYQFYWYKRSLREFWKTHKGDCTERANSIVYFLGKNGIKARKVHGYTWSEKGFGLHDWYEYEINGTWYSHEWINYDKIKKKGNGIW